MIETLVDWETKDYQAIVNLTDHWPNHASSWCLLDEAIWMQMKYNEIFNGYLYDCELKNLG